MESGGDVFTGRGFARGTIAARGGLITTVDVGEESAAPRGDVPVIAPGFIDCHVHGTMGHDVMDGSVDAFRALSEALPQWGTTAYVATTLTEARERLLQALRAGAEWMHGGPYRGRSALLGVHLEGPYIAPGRAGAQPPEYIRPPDREELAELMAAAPVCLVTMAPEVAGAIPAIRRLTEAGVRVNLGHTTATFEQAAAGFQAGADGLTHAYNAMPPLLHREPGILGQAFRNSGVFWELICDGIHVHPAVVQATMAMVGERVVWVTDATAATGLGDGTHRLGQQEIIVTDGAVRLPTGTLAGSVLTQAQALRNALEWGISWREALRALSSTPARRLGLTDRGGLAPGRRADWVALDPLTGHILQTVIGGETAYAG